MAGSFRLYGCFCHENWRNTRLCHPTPLTSKLQVQACSGLEDVRKQKKECIKRFCACSQEYLFLSESCRWRHAVMRLIWRVLRREETRSPFVSVEFRCRGCCCCFDGDCGRATHARSNGLVKPFSGFMCQLMSSIGYL